MGCFPGRLMSAASDQKLFCKLCSPFCWSFDRFVDENVISPSYSSAILTPPRFFIFASLIIESHLRVGWKWPCHALFPLWGGTGIMGEFSYAGPHGCRVPFPSPLERVMIKGGKGASLRGITGASRTELDPSTVAPSAFPRKLLPPVSLIPQALCSASFLWRLATTSPDAQRTQGHHREAVLHPVLPPWM